MDQCFCIAILDLKLSKEEFLDLTPYDFALLCDFNKNKMKTEYGILRNVIFNAVLNVHRKKGSKEIPLFNSESNVVVNDKEKAKKEREELFGN